MDLRYVEFLSPGNLFYELVTPNKIVNNYRIPSLNSEEWQQNTDINWSYCINTKKKMPKQGWKIHITTDIDEAQKTLDIVLPYLIENEISFKFVPNERQLLFKNSKNGDRASSGKFITIYPYDNKTFLTLLSDLDNLTKALKKGPYILNDKRWKYSNVFFRYGAFVSMYVNKDGQNVPAIQRPDGTLIPDVRAPYYEVPDFVEEPVEIQIMTKKVDAELDKEDTSKFDSYNVISALHFSNGGGVYKVEKNGKTFVMKEGRLGSGLDRLKLDGFKRIYKEAETIKQLSEKPYIVDFYDYFEIWENNYLIEEHVSGISLMEYVSQNFPFSYKEDKDIYMERMMHVIDQLIDALKDLHRSKIALGDLQPNNVLVLEDYSIKLIDLETAVTPESKYTPALMTPGYVTDQAETFEQADWYALLRICRFLFLPIENLSDLSIDIEINQDKWIGENFGDEVLNKIQEIQEKTLPTIKKLSKAATLTIPPMKINYKNVNEITEGLRAGIMSHLKPKSESLISGDIRQFIEKMGSLSIANGGFGGIMALDRTGTLSDSVYQWVDHVLETILNLDTETYKNFPLGLFNGISGILSVLYDIGYKEEAIKLLETMPFPDTEDSDLTLFSGLSGIGLNYLAFYSITQKKDFLDRSIKIGNRIIDAYKEDCSITVRDPYAMPYGLLNGWSGISLYILMLGKATNDNDLIKLASEIFNKEISKNIEIDSKLELAQIKEYSLGYKRLIPYLGEGAAGIALIMLEFNKNLPDFMTESNTELFKKLTNVTDLYSTFASGIFRGVGGMIILANAMKCAGVNTGSLEYTIKALGNYLLYKKHEGILSPGEYGYRLSLDLQTGNSGLLLALSDIDSDKWSSWLPLPKNNNLNLFEIDKFIKGGETNEKAIITSAQST
ncbi:MULTISPECIES: class III lanthionine synthetase LanKC [Bacillus]|nr:class III lanthionine synthetase LanKC [Bacillus subtilis]WJD93028.1 class III lanthionine synthetase LanKC [Bacillus spizizenii]AGI27758.1 Serine/threonine protein kinase [Bacillus subtilis subsp. subtilis str. BAB-1]AKD33888.1 Serine/threonine protein kinase [Bacillus subtilis HJ5]ALS83322.1 serine/threonine protein kinase [Bacillus subtilis subsp. subtilis]ASK22486.1 Serine/threonine protein kinase [Bacillus subtilis]